MPVRTVKITAKIPFNLENRLVNKWGFTVDKRITGDYILFRKNYVSDKKEKPDDGLKRTIRASVDKPASTTVDTKVVWPDFKKNDGLTIGQKKFLEKRCDNIVNFFPDPYAVPESVRARLMIAMQGMTLLEAQFVMEYMDENFPVVDTGK